MEFNEKTSDNFEKAKYIIKTFYAINEELEKLYPGFWEEVQPFCNLEISEGDGQDTFVIRTASNNSSAELAIYDAEENCGEWYWYQINTARNLDAEVLEAKITEPDFTDHESIKLNLTRIIAIDLILYGEPALVKAIKPFIEELIKK